MGISPIASDRRCYGSPGQRKLDNDGHKAAYPFGFGLGYTTFELAKPFLPSEEGSLKATVEVHNTGQRAGSTVVQAYAIDSSQPAEQQVWHLLGFQRVDVTAGEITVATLDCDMMAISRRIGRGIWSITQGDWYVILAQHAHDPESTPAVALPQPPE